MNNQPLSADTIYCLCSELEKEVLCSIASVSHTLERSAKINSLSMQKNSLSTIEDFLLSNKTLLKSSLTSREDKERLEQVWAHLITAIAVNEKLKGFPQKDKPLREYMEWLRLVSEADSQ